jgi:hypothetical protein
MQQPKCKINRRRVGFVTRKPSDSKSVISCTLNSDKNISYKQLERLDNVQYGCFL